MKLSILLDTIDATYIITVTFTYRYSQRSISGVEVK